MAEISGYVKGPYEGVSQAPPQVRLQGACDAMEDCLPSIPNGVQKRPPWEWQAKLLKVDGVTQITLDPMATFVDIPRGDLSQDLTLLLNREAGHVIPYLFNTATWAPVALTKDGAALTYLDTNMPIPTRDLRVASIEDTTFITNRTVPTALAAGVTTARPFEALIWCKLSGYSRRTVVTVTSAALGGSYTASFKTGSGSNSNDPLSVGTDKLAKALYDATNPAPGNDTPNPNPLSTLSGSGFTVILDGSLIYLSHDSVDFQLQVSDDIGGTGVIAIKGSVQRFSDLPGVAHDGFTVRVAQEAAGGNSDYYVQFVANSASTMGTWKEVLAPGSDVGLDPTTMPVGIVEDSPGVWHLKALPWKQRLTGTKTLSPDPEFIGSAINDIGWWSGRLALVSHGQVNLSASDDPFKFYTTTLITSLDSDPIGLLTPVDIKTFFKEAAIFDQRFLAMGNKGQAIVSKTTGKGAATPGTTAIDALSKSEYTDQVKTQGANHKIYFAAPRGDYFSFFELAIDRISGLALPEDMTPGVPRYLPSTIDRAATFESDYLTIYGSSDSPRLFIHMFRHAEQQRVQNAWHAWNLPAGFTLGGLYIKNSIAYVALVDSSRHGHAITMDLAQLKLDPNGGTVLTCADLRVAETALPAPTYDGSLHRTTFALPYPAGALTGASVRLPMTGGGFPEGYAPVVTATSGSTVTIQGDWRGVHLWFGYKYASYFVPSQFYKFGQDGTPERTGRLNINRVKIDLARLSYLRAEVSIKGRDTRLVEYNGFDVDDPTSRVDNPSNRRTVVMTFPVGGKSDDSTIKLVNDTFLGFALLGYEWEGIWNPRAQRVT